MIGPIPMAAAFLMKAIPIRGEKPVAIIDRDMQPVCEKFIDQLLIAFHNRMIAYMLAYAKINLLLLLRNQSVKEWRTDPLSGENAERMQVLRLIAFTA